MLKTKNFFTMWRWIAAMVIIPVTAYVRENRQSSCASMPDSGITELHQLESLAKIDITTLLHRWYQTFSSLLDNLMPMCEDVHLWTKGVLAVTGSWHQFSFAGNNCDTQNVPAGYLFQYHTIPSFKSH